jgi:hypothetical protein
MFAAGPGTITAVVTLAAVYNGEELRTMTFRLSASNRYHSH